MRDELFYTVRVRIKYPGRHRQVDCLLASDWRKIPVRNHGRMRRRRLIKMEGIVIMTIIKRDILDLGAISVMRSIEMEMEWLVVERAFLNSVATSLVSLV